METLQERKTNFTSAAKHPVLKCADLHRSLGVGEACVRALNGVSLELHLNRTYAIAGPSGCGKSTLLYCLGLLDRVDDGQIFIRGKDVSKMNERMRTQIRLSQIGFVFQFHFLLAEFSALENVMLPMMRAGEIPLSERKKRAATLLDRVGLADKMSRKANRLSGGEQQRVAVARALANSPAVVLADEPTGNLDAANAELVVELLRKVAREDRCAVAIVTHNPAIAEGCDVQLRMRDGEFV